MSQKIFDDGIALAKNLMWWAFQAILGRFAMMVSGLKTVFRSGAATIDEQWNSAIIAVSNEILLVT